MNHTKDAHMHHCTFLTPPHPRICIRIYTHLDLYTHTHMLALNPASLDLARRVSFVFARADAQVKVMSHLISVSTQSLFTRLYYHLLT